MSGAGPEESEDLFRRDEVVFYFDFFVKGRLIWGKAEFEKTFCLDM